VSPFPWKKRPRTMVGLVAKSTWECPPPPLGFYPS